MRYFVAMVEAGSISEASRRLLISQPSLTVALRDMERELGTPLLVRTAKGVHPTEPGRFLYASAQRMLRESAATTEHLRNMAEGRAGHLGLAITPSYSWGFLPRVLEQLGAQAPGVQVELHDPPPLGIINEVANGNADVGIVATHDVPLLRATYRRTFAMLPLCEMPIVALLPTAHPAPEPIRLDDLRDDPWVIPVSSPGFPGMASLINHIWARAGWTPQVIRKVSTSQTSLPIVAGRLGVTLLPHTVACLATAGVRISPLAETVQPLTAVLLCQRGRPLSPAARTFMDIARRQHEEATGASAQGEGAPGGAPSSLPPTAE